jgi:hypothetical protein
LAELIFASPEVGGNAPGTGNGSATSFAKAIRKAGVPVEILIIKNDTRGIDILVPDVQDKILDFCGKHLKGEEAK